MLTWLLIFPLLVYSAVEGERQMLEKYGQKYLGHKHTAF
jgi:hypothetical protein